MNKDRYEGRHYFRFLHHDNASSFGFNLRELIEACKGEFTGQSRRIRRWMESFGHNYMSRDNMGRLCMARLRVEHEDNP